ncbi:reverse transcriptase family protein [Roseiconus lacunae]|uniref:reverse transcriptase family protein n=1 Tax=Roseiconus lacunae TaxID=2605694 RepID=UPI0011F30045|nr:reverse transcriptase family protein [Roseiconus lacunae]
MADQSPNQASNQQPASPNPKLGWLGRIFRSLFGGPTRRPDRSSDSFAAMAQQPRPLPPRRREKVTLDLDAKAFLPIDRDELLSDAKQINLWASPWFGRRDLIPPADDPRTSLIDRGMVTEGLLTPDELTRIHEVGAEMDYYRPAELFLRHQARQAGRDAVELDRQTRAERKARKQAEAEAKRIRRRERVERRFATQIDFLGRGVSTQLHLCESDVDRLKEAGLPVIQTTTELADAMGIEIPRLRWLAFHSHVAERSHYISFRIPKKSGGTRTLSAPLPRLAAAQRWIYSQILRERPHPECVSGFVPGRSILTGAAPHVGSQTVLNLDLEDFFPSIGFARIRHAFQFIGYSPAVATVLALLCSEAPRRKVRFNGGEYYVATGPRVLPQGACTSPALSNLIAAKLDRRISGLASKLGATYTRYADDLTLSGDRDFDDKAAFAMACVRHIAEDEGFRVKLSKTRVLRQNAAQRVTGLVVNDKAGVGRKKLRLIRAILHNAEKTGLNAQNRDHHPNFRASLEGTIAFVAMSNPERAAKLRRQLDAVPD